MITLMKINYNSPSDKWIVPIHGIYLAQDDKKKNTAVRLSMKSKIKLHQNLLNYSVDV